MQVKNVNATGVEIVIVALVIGAVFWSLKKTAGAVVAGVGAAADATLTTATGVLTGNNVITQNANSTAYQGAGVIGTLGAATDTVSGGLFSNIGQSIGSKIFDWTH